jgi:uncharacterized protein YeaO (DUF488 family)
MSQGEDPMPFTIKRAYDAPLPSDGYRVLVDRLWPRGLSRKKLKIDAWMKDLAPSNELRQWFHKDETQWAEFEKRYFRELEAQPDLLNELKAKARLGQVTLVFAKRDEQHNNAVALKRFLERK